MSVHDLRPGDIIRLTGKFDYYLQSGASSRVTGDYPGETFVAKEVANTDTDTTLHLKGQECRVILADEEKETVVIELIGMKNPYYCTDKTFLSRTQIELVRRRTIIRDDDLFCILEAVV